MTEGVCQGAGWGKAPWKLLSSLVWGSKWSVTQQKLVSVPTENIFFSYFNLHNTDKSHIPAKGMKNLSFLPSWEHKMTFRMSISLFPGGSVVKNPPANVGDAGSIPRSWRYPGGGNGNPLRYSLPGKSHGQRSLAGYSPWGCKESDMTERRSLTHRHVKGERSQPERAPKGQSWSKLSNKINNSYRQTLETLRAWFQTTVSKANIAMRKVRQIFGFLMYIKVMFTLHSVY